MPPHWIRKKQNGIEVHTCLIQGVEQNMITFLGIVALLYTNACQFRGLKVIGQISINQNEMFLFKILLRIF